MPEYDISMHGIRVVLDPAYYGSPARKAPVDVEGTALSVVNSSKRGLDMMRAGRFIELICDPDYMEAIDVFIRWDTDEKEWFCGGTFLLRRAKGSFCSSIWTLEGGVKLDRRGYHDLNPQYYTYKPGIFESKYGKIDTYTTKYLLHANDAPQMVTYDAQPTAVEPAVYGDVLAIPRDGQWYRVVFQGVHSWGRKAAGGYEVKEDIPGAQIQFIVDLPEPPIENWWVGGDIEVGQGTVDNDNTDIGHVTMEEPVQFDNIVIQNNAAPPMPHPPGTPDVGGNTNAVGTTTTTNAGDWYEIGEDFDDDF